MDNTEFNIEETKLLRKEIDLLTEKVKFYSQRSKNLETELIKKDIELDEMTKAYHRAKVELTFMLDSIPSKNGIMGDIK